MISKLRDFAQAALAADLSKGLQEFGQFLHVVLDEHMRLRLVDTVQKFADAIKGPDEEDTLPSTSVKS